MVGAGAAGLMAAIAAGREANERGEDLRILAIDGAKSLGAKILVAGGGRCNVTHDEVDEKQFAPVHARNAIRKVLGRFTVEQTVLFFREIGVELKREETGKLFPVTDRARTVLDALLQEAARLGIEICHPCRVSEIRRSEHVFQLHCETRENGTDKDEIVAGRVILATGGKSLPKTGSDGFGYTLAKSLGHTISNRVFPALVPLVFEAGHFLTKLSGITLPATLEVRLSTKKRLCSFTNSLLFTHFGLSGPVALDISRYLIEAKLDDPASTLVLNLLPGESVESVDAALRDLGRRTALQWARERMPERLSVALMEHAGVSPTLPGNQLTRESRRALSLATTELPVPVTGDRGFSYAEVTAGGLPLSEIRVETMESRVCPGLYLCGEVCDVDGRIGGYNFQWAWASGHIAGVSSVSML